MGCGGWVGQCAAGLGTRAAGAGGVQQAGRWVRLASRQGTSLGTGPTGAPGSNRGWRLGRLGPRDQTVALSLIALLPSTCVACTLFLPVRRLGAKRLPRHRPQPGCVRLTWLTISTPVCIRLSWLLTITPPCVPLVCGVQRSWRGTTPPRHVSGLPTTSPSGEAAMVPSAAPVSGRRGGSRRKPSHPRTPACSHLICAGSDMLLVPDPFPPPPPTPTPPAAATSSTPVPTCSWCHPCLSPAG